MKALKSIPLFVLIIFVSGILFKVSQKARAEKNLKPNVIGTVVKVADGDTLTVNVDGEKTKIRLCGIDAPEKAQALGEESKLLLEKLALNKQVAFSEIERDRYGRTVAEVFVLGASEVFVNGDMVQNGMAYHYDRYSGKCPNRDVIMDAEKIAQSKNSGVWASSNIRPWDYRKNK